MADRAGEAGRQPELDAVYRERNQIVAALTFWWLSVVAPATDFEGWWVVYLATPGGQLSWHFHPRDMDLFAHVRRVDAWHWDGHNTTEKYRRLLAAALTEGPYS